MKVARVVLLGALACASIAGVAATRLNGISKGAPVVPLVKVTLGGAADPCSEALGSCYGWCGPGAAGECKAQCMDTFNKCNQDPGYVDPDDGPDPNDPDFRPNNPAPSEDPDDGAKVAVAVSSDGDFGPIETCEMGCNDLEGKCVAHCPMGDMTCIAPCQDAAKECLGVCPGCGEDCTSTFKACVASGSSPASCSMAQNACLANCPLTVAATAPVAACDPTKLPDCLKTCTDAYKPCLIACGPQNQACTATCVTSFKTCGQDCACNPSAAPAVESAEDVHTTILPESEYRAQFTAFVKKYNKKYSSDEFFSRYAIFKANLNKIRVHHSIRSTFRMAVNEFADMTFAEFHSKMTGYNRRDKDVLRKHNAEGPHSKLDVLASSVDWRQKNAVTPVKNQQQCGSCWAFSTTGSTEGAHAIKTGNLVSLSEQQLVDCSSAQGNQGCNGGMMDQGFQYIITNGGITTEDAYPYTAQQGTCQTNVTVAATLSSFVDVTPGSETALMQAVNLGPVSVAIEADQQCFQFYSGGILSDPSCGTNLDHGVLVVGYGTDNTVSPPANYWIVKNSWGESWGENGYIRLSRGNNECGIATEPSYPVV